jgi:hypothetical protein
MAPARFAGRARDAGADAQRFWRELRYVIVPAGGGGTLNGMRELLRGLYPTAGSATYRGEANGPSSNCAASGGSFSNSYPLPTTAPISVFSFLVRRDSSATIQHLIGNGALSAGGWSFQLNYGSGQIGLTRWNSGDTVSTTLGAVPNTGGQASCVAFSYDGTNCRFFLNGRYQTVASGSLVAPSNNVISVGRNVSSLNALVNTSIHVIYVWARTLSDGEMLALYRDPWAPIRPRVSVYDGSSVSTTVARVTQAALEALIALPVQTRTTQVLVEALIAAPSTPSTARISSLVLEALTQPDATARLTQLALEVLHQPTPGVRATQVDLEALTQPDPTARITQLSLEALVQVGALTPTYTGQLFPRGSPPPF